MDVQTAEIGLSTVMITFKNYSFVHFEVNKLLLKIRLLNLSVGSLETNAK